MNVPTIISLCMLGFMGVQYARYRMCTKDYRVFTADSKIPSNFYVQTNSQALQKLAVFRKLQNSIHEGMTLVELIDAFAQMCSVPVGEPDDLLFEAGHYRLGTDIYFLFSMVRQFKFRSGDEYVQLKMAVKFPHKPILWWLYATRWSMDIRGDFFDYVKKHLVFKLLQNAQIAGIEVSIQET